MDDHQPKSRSDPRNGALRWARVFPDKLLFQLQGLSDATASTYIKFWCYYLGAHGEVADDAPTLARATGITRAGWLKARQELIEMGRLRACDGRLCDAFADEQIEYFLSRSRGARKSVQSRWGSPAAEDAG